MTILVAVTLPLLAAAAVALGGGAGAFAWRVLPWTPLALLPPLLTREQVWWSWSLLGLRLGVDELTAPFVMLTAIAWTLAGWFAHAAVAARERPFWLGWSLSLAGMTLLLLAQTLTAFYLGFVLLSLSAYLMIVHARHEAAWRAGRIYMIMALAGEAAILTGALVVAGVHGATDVPLAALAASEPSRVPAFATWLLLAGFAVKLGVVPLHVWLPLAHPIAPVPASAILSGIIVKAGLLGWLRLAPPHAPDALEIGPVLLVLGFVTAFSGVLLGLAQSKLKTVLAYSTVSQMGLVLVGFSTLYLAPGSWQGLAGVLGLIALHHGLNKASLFLAAGCAPGASRARLVLVALPALSLAAAPFTTGFLAKEWLKSSLAAAALPSGIEVVLSLTSAATALLMWRVWRLARSERAGAVPPHPSWSLLTAAALTVPWLWAAGHGLLVAPTGYALWAATWPLLLALALVAAGALLRRPGLALPEGDVVVVFERVGRRLAAAIPRDALGPRDVRPIRLAPAAAVVEEVERRLREVSVAGLTLLVVGGIVWLVLAVR